MYASAGKDHEGISIYDSSDSTGFILVSDQASSQFHIFPREGAPGKQHEHLQEKIIKVQAVQSDGSEITSFPLSYRFKKGLFVVMSDDRTFNYYRAEDILF